MTNRILAASLLAALSLTTFGLLACGGGSTRMSTVTVSPSSPSPSPSPSPSSPSTSTPQAGATVIDNIDDGNWKTCGACGNAGGTGAVANYSATVNLASPSEDGTATRFSIAASVPFTNGYFFQVHNPIAAQINALTYEFDVYVPNGSENAPQAIEFECQQKFDGWLYSFSWQADYGSNIWRIYNFGAGQWEPSGLTLQRFAPGTWHHVAAEYHNDVNSHLVFHDALTIDGVRTPVNIQRNAFFSGSANQFTNALQLDSNNHAEPYQIYVDKMKITYR